MTIKEMTIKFGLDMGQSSIKLTGAKGRVGFPSLAALLGASSADVSLGKRKKRPMVVRIGEQDLYVGHNAHRYGVPLENFSFDRLAGVTPEMRAILYGAMTEYQRRFGLFDEPVQVVVGLPMQMLMGEADAVAKFNKQVKGWIGGHHAWTADGNPFEMEITGVSLAPQAFGAVVDYAFDLDGNAISEERTLALKRECASVSIGSNTVELQVTKRDEDTKRFNGGKAIGVRWLHNQVDPNGMYSFGEFDELLREGDLPDEMSVDKFLGAWSTEILGFIDKKWEGKFQRFHKIFIVGGGSILLKPYLETQFNGKAIFFNDPIWPISSGLFKAALGMK